MALIFSELEPGQIEGLWPRYVPGLQEYLKRWPQNIEWKMEDVKQAIRKDTARIINVYIGKDQIGFVVYRRFYEEFSKHKYLHLWLGYLFREHRGRIKEFLPEVFEYLSKVSKRYGARYIEFDSPRKGWERIMDSLDMKPRRMVYRKEVAA